jgi:hypothetical protein
MQFENNEDSCDAQILTRIIFYSQVYECIRESHPRSFLLNGSVIFFLAYSKPCGFLMDKLCRDLNFSNHSSPGILFLNGVLMLFVSTNILTASITSLLERPNPHFSIVLMQFAKRISSSDDKAVGTSS